MSTVNRRPLALALGALVAAFALAFVLGKASKHTAAPAAAAPALQTVALPSQKPAVANLQTVEAVPALRAAPRKAKAKTTTPSAATTSTNPSPTTANPSPAPATPNPAPATSGGGGTTTSGGGSTSGGGNAVVGGGTG